jgi:hypothetical protein
VLGGCIVAACLLVDGAAFAEANTAQCKRLTRQIHQYKGVAEMAAQRGDKLWLEGTLAHVQRLSDRRIKMCPQFDQPSIAERMSLWMKQVAHTAGKAFLRYLTFGAY